ncbi:hypothetical protein F5Y14DRAFT_238093 [Nemania sp. NC0429]|nr:hypothetical protein F5Y14DRAFT_238093 [Nemania sp. NC0429]
MMLALNTYPSRTQQSPYRYYHGGQQQQQLQQQPPQPQLYHQQPQIQPDQQHLSQQFPPGHIAVSNPAAFSTTLDNIPTAAAALAATQRYHHPRPATSNGQRLNSMSSDPWILHGQHTPRQNQPFGHQRDSSLSSIGSNTPASPYNANTTNPQIAITDAIGDGFHDISSAGDGGYGFGMTKPMTMPDHFYGNTLDSLSGHSGGGMSGHDIMGDMSTADGLPALSGAQHHGQGRLAPTSDMPAPGMSTRSRPVSVASSIGGDSPVTPSFHEHEDDHRRVKNASATRVDMPKLDRTMTDVYSDELYSPTFAITSASPSPQTHLALSPGNDLFTQRLQTANNRHLFAAHSPISVDSRGQSPFRQGSPYATTLNEIPRVGTNQARLESAQQLRERKKAEEDAKQLQQQLARNSHQGQQQQQSTPATISPKDAMLEFNEADMDANFPLFPSREAPSYGLGQNNGNGNGSINRVAPQPSASPFQSMPTTPMRGDFNFSMPSNVQIPQQYPFVSRQQPLRQQQQLTPSASTFSRMGSAETSNTDGGSSNDGRAQRPDRTAADGGTYTCTYHGCTLRFETPALLQKHKREGHRQASALTNHLRGSTGTTGIDLPESIVANSQAGPHRCDRINPSTGKPCNTVFSRPYDLTRHEDTIHNARKQKVRCDLCTEEKTFSRADALTRHYRVCHPDAELPGKHRRRGGAVGV